MYNYLIIGKKYNTIFLWVKLIGYLIGEPVQQFGHDTGTLLSKHTRSFEEKLP